MSQFSKITEEILSEMIIVKAQNSNSHFEKVQHELTKGVSR